MNSRSQSGSVVSVTRLLDLTNPVAIAHRGGSRLRPENTLLAFDHALAGGVDALECDVHLSLDGEPVVIHDATLDRTTDAAGPVTALTAAALARVDAGHRFGADQGFPYRGRGVYVPRLAEVLERSQVVPVIVELKGEDPRLADRAIDVILECGAADRVLVAGFSQALLMAVRRRAPQLVTGASQQEVQAAFRRAYVRLGPRRPMFRAMQVPVRLRGQRVLTRAFVRVLRRTGIPTQAWIVDEAEEMRVLLEWGITGLISDRPDTAVAVVREHASRLAR
jgi:glycerophosphoryl diester phosphodiesterase